MAKAPKKVEGAEEEAKVESAKSPNAGKFVKLRDSLSVEERAEWARQGYPMTVAALKAIKGESADADKPEPDGDNGGGPAKPDAA